ncbi:MAG: membrane dipeptidase, partial [Rikenellaceae bacterium]
MERIENTTPEGELRNRAVEIHALNPTVDSHCDTPMLYEEGGFNFESDNNIAKVDLPKMTRGHLDTAIVVAYLPQFTPPDQATSKALEILRRFKTDIAKLNDKVVIAKGVGEIFAAKFTGLKSIMLGVENGLAIGSDISNIDLFKKEGAIYITLCHNGSNNICDSAVGSQPHNGVSSFGRQVIERMNNLGITVDISHSAESSTWDALRLSRQPIIASHSSCKAICDHPRNLSDETIKAIASQGGVVQICAYSAFLNPDENKASIHDIVAHIEHVITLTKSYNFVGIGSDFDG